MVWKRRFCIEQKLVKNTEAATFSVKTNFLNPIYGVQSDNNGNYKHIVFQIKESIDRTRSYASVTYDSLWVAALAENDTKATDNINYLKNTLVRIANSYNGVTGNTKLNQNGDRKYGDYDFWAVTRNNNTNNNTHDAFTWKRVSKYKLVEVGNKKFRDYAYKLANTFIPIQRLDLGVALFPNKWIVCDCC